MIPDLLSGGRGTRPKNVSTRPIYMQAESVASSYRTFASLSMMGLEKQSLPSVLMRVYVLPKYRVFMMVRSRPEVGLVSVMSILLCSSPPSWQGPQGMGPVHENMKLFVTVTTMGSMMELNGLRRSVGPRASSLVLPVALLLYRRVMQLRVILRTTVVMSRSVMASMTPVTPLSEHMLFFARLRVFVTRERCA